MTNYERLLDLPFRWVLKEFGNPTKLELAEVLSYLMRCGTDTPACSECESLIGSCRTVCEAWLDAEAKPDAIFNDDSWHDTREDLPQTSDITLEYQVFIHGAELPCQLIFDGDSWLDDYGNYYIVDWWRPLPNRSQVSE